jgi:hypothetical protein
MPVLSRVLGVTTIAFGALEFATPDCAAKPTPVAPPADERHGVRPARDPAAVSEPHVRRLEDGPDGIQLDGRDRHAGLHAPIVPDPCRPGCQAGTETPTPPRVWAP